ncbi:MAG TPA: UTP--glucose-1-phosphate uridylyltransferase GalU [Chloroflexota bacterium]|nr:UTP--glucose-1-phosphate uridylyltransferase GalU [Chloroflexota bacterium]
MKKVRKAVIPAAGLGTRFLPATKAQPKEMLPIVDKPVIQYIVEEAVASGIEQIVIITGQSKRAIEDHFDYPFELAHRLRENNKIDELHEVERLSELANFVYVRQKQPLGNGHAVLVAREVIGDEPFAVLWGDDLVDAQVPCLQQLISVYEQYGTSVMAVMRVAKENISKYGVIDPRPVSERIHEVIDLVEKPSQDSAPSDLAAVKGFVLTPEIFEELERTPAGKGGEIWLSDAIKSLMRRQKVFALEFDGKRYDAGNKLEFLQATVDFALKRPDLSDDFRAYLKGLAL